MRAFLKNVQGLRSLALPSAPIISLASWLGRTKTSDTTTLVCWRPLPARPLLFEVCVQVYRDVLWSLNTLLPSAISRLP